MATYYYNPPELDADGTPFPPFVFEYSGDLRVVMAHKYWKMVKQPYVIERYFDKQGKPVINRETGEQSVLRGFRTAWVLDDEKNALLAAGKLVPPDNIVTFGRQEWKDLQQSKHRKFLQHLVSKESMDKKERQNFEELKRAQFEEIEREKKLIEQERLELRAVRAEREALKAEMTAEIAEIRESQKKAAAKKEAR